MADDKFVTPGDLKKLADECDSWVEYQNLGGMKALLRTVAAIARYVANIPCNPPT